MAGINTLLGVYEQKGDKFLKSLLNNYVIINKQLNGSFFGMSATHEGKINFHKNGGEITLIDRILMKYYDRAITQMESIPSDVRASIPNNYFFGMEYFNEQDVDEGISPQNCLTLSHVKVTGQNGDSTYIHDKSILDKWADRLGIDRPPILFSGYLNEEQKSKILDFVYSPSEELLAKFKSNSFTTHVLSILGSEMNEGNSIDEIVFRFYPDEESETDVTLAKVIDPVFAELIKSNEQSKKVPNDYLYLIIIDLMNFIEMYSIKDLMAVSDKAKSFEENYVALVDKIYVDFIDKFKYKYLDITLQLPEFMQRPEFDVNLDMVRSETAKEMIGVCPTFKEIYKILMNFFRKKKSKPTGLFNSNLVMQFNRLVDKIKNVVIGSNISESYFPSFYQFTGSISEDLDSMHSLTVKQRYDSYKKTKKVNIIVDYFQPLTNDHINAARLMQSRNKMPVVFVLINAPECGHKFPLKPESAKRLMKLAKVEFGDLIADVIDVDINSVNSVVGALHPKYQPILWGAPKNRMNDYLLQMDFAKNKSVVYNVSKNFKLIELPVNANCQKVFDLIRDEKYQAYKEYVPKSIHSEFFNLRIEIADK